MPCYHPLKAFPIGRTDSGKIDYKVTPYNIHHLELHNGQWIKCGDSFTAPSCESVVNRFIEVPCGQCVGCRLDRSREWANRCMMELKYHEQSYFVTLTYDDEHIPLHEYFDRDTGELHYSESLVKEDFQLFMKRLRKRYPYENKLRYFACGEYGDHTARPHYHAIIFGLKLDDLELYSESSAGFSYYVSPFLTDVWSNGHVIVASVSWDTCAYTARYIMKKLTGPAASVYADFNIEPEFTLMSRRPGIAKKYFEDHPGLMEYDQISVSTETGGISFKPPRYFEKLEEVINPPPLQSFNEKYASDSLRIAESIRNCKLDSTSLEYEEMLLNEEASKLSQIKSLERKCI